MAEWNGEWLPCVHKHWWNNRAYYDPGSNAGCPKAEELAAAIGKAGRVILTDDIVSEDQ